MAFLESPSSYPHRPREVRSIQTHISWVFIAPPFVFKVKKPVNLGFLDFSTLEKRHHFCQRELELNRRLCPEVYLGVVPIYTSGDDFSFKADGELAEYTLKMKELPKGWFLSELLAKELVGETEINRVISCLHRFYEAQTLRPEVEAWGTPQKLKISIDENFAQVEPFVGKTISPLAFDAIRSFTNNFHAANARLFQERIQQRRIRDCHGDLHLDHVHITPEATTKAPRRTAPLFSTRHLADPSTARSCARSWRLRAFVSAAWNCKLPMTRLSCASDDAKRARPKSPMRAWKISRF